MDSTAADVTTPRPARRVTACQRLTLEHAVQRQRVQDEPILVAWKVERRANGQELISISSDESSGDDDDDKEDKNSGNQEISGSSLTGYGGSAAASGNDENSHDDEDNDEYEYTSECEADVLSVAEERQAETCVEPSNSDSETQRKRNNAVIDVDEDSGSHERQRGARAHAIHVLIEPKATPPPQQKQLPTIYSIDSDDSNSDGGYEIVKRPSSSDDIADKCAIAEAREREHAGDQAFEFFSGDMNADGNTTPETATDSSCGELDTRIKSEAVKQLLALKTESTAVAVVSHAVAVSPELQKRPEPASLPAPIPAAQDEEKAEGELVIKPDPTAVTSVVPKKVIPLMRRKKLDEEDAAFLLFYGISEAPTARILGLIIGTQNRLFRIHMPTGTNDLLLSFGISEYIDRCVGESSAFMARCAKFLLWRKMNAHVNAGIEAERLARSEWMKIVFSSEDPSMRLNIYRSQLLPRPVRITVRPLQFVRKRASGGGYMMASFRHDALVSPGRIKGEQAGVFSPKQNGRVNGLVLNGVLQQLSPPTKASDFREQPMSHKNTLKHRKQPPGFAASTKKRKAEKITAAVPDSPVAQSPIKAVPYTPRKHRRRNGSITLYDIELPTRGKAKNGGLSKSSEILRPLSSNQVTAGVNRSLPHGRRDMQDEDDDGEALDYRRRPCIQVCPLQNMSAEDLKNHITSVQSEGRIKSFEKLSDIISKLMTDPRNYRGVFNAPVDPVALNLPTYTSIIKVGSLCGNSGPELLRPELRT